MQFKASLCPSVSSAAAEEREPIECDCLPNPGLTSEMVRRRYANETLSCKGKLRADLANLLDTIPRASVAFSGLALTPGCLLRLHYLCLLRPLLSKEVEEGSPGSSSGPTLAPPYGACLLMAGLVITFRWSWRRRSEAE